MRRERTVKKQARVDSGGILRQARLWRNNT